MPNVKNTKNRFKRNIFNMIKTCYLPTLSRRPPIKVTIYVTNRWVKSALPAIFLYYLGLHANRMKY